MRFASLYADFIKTMIAHRRLCDMFVLLMVVATVRGLNITRCKGPYNDSYTCPGLSDPPERTQCCLWDGQPACCPPGGSSCSDSHVNKRNYCPGPSNGTELTQCCVWNSQPACCFPGGSSCRDSADTRSYCPGPDHGSERTHCCIWDKQPTCCLPGGSSCEETHFRDYCPGPNDKKNFVSCCAEGYDKECCSNWTMWTFELSKWDAGHWFFFLFLVSFAVLFVSFFCFICGQICRVKCK